MTIKAVDLAEEFAACVDEYPPDSTFWLAYSGGVDSHVLLHIAAQAFRRRNQSGRLLAIHINHQLQSQSGDWLRHCESVCRLLSVPLESVAVDAHPKQGESPEAAARTARYEAIKRLFASNDVLLTAHHQDDQAETVLLQLFRGAGPAGLAAMPKSQRFGPGYHCRPFLAAPKQLLRDYAKHHALEHIEDPSNESELYQRNFLRNSVMPLIRARWPAAAETISRSAKHSAETSELNVMLAEIDAEAVITADGCIDLSALGKLPPERQKNSVRHWLYSKTGYFPSSRMLEELFAHVINAREDAEPKLEVNSRVIRRYRSLLFLVDDFKKLPLNWSVKWEDLCAPLDIPELASRLPVRILPSDLSDHSHVEVRVRRGGETIRMPGRPRKPLKSLLQESGVPPWLRDRLPLIFVDDELVAVYGLDKFRTANKNQ